MIFVGEELFANVGALGPFPEFLFALVAGVEVLQSEPLALNGETIGGKIATPEATKLSAEFAEASPPGLGVLFLSDHGLGEGGQMNGRPVGEFAG